MLKTTYKFCGICQHNEAVDSLRRFEKASSVMLPCAFHDGI
jgi:hypothetical protein